MPKWSSEPELRLSTSITSYPPVAGSVELRRAIKDREGLRYGANLGVNNILITNGALHGLSLIFRCIGGPVLFQAPLYAGIYHQLANAAIRAKLLHDWTGNVKQFEHALEQHADVNAIYVNIPHNPTGECIDKEKFELLSWYCSRHDLYLIIDMVYDSFVYGSNCVNYPSDKRWAKTILVNSLSKNYGAPNLRAGWIAASEKTIGILRGALESDCIAVSGHVQEVACSLLRNGNDELVERVRRGRNTVRTVRRLPERATL